MKRLAARVTPDALRQVRGGHPWVFASSITSLTPGGEPGDLAVVFDPKRRFAAIGLYDPASPLRIKVLAHGRPVTIDAAFWRHRLTAALAVRAGLAADGATTAYRVVHGENDGFPGLVLDRYEATLVLKLYSAAWLPHLDALVAVIDQELAPDALVLRLSRGLRDQHPGPGRPGAGGGVSLTEGTALLGTTPTGPVLYREHGLAFEADVVHGQKTGAFLDQRDTRALVASRAGGRSVLDVFACTGGFSVHAAAAGARSVHLVDLSPVALATARRNLVRNASVAAVARATVDTTVGDAFAVMADMARRGERFDVVVVDPPSFAQQQSQVARGLAAYRRLTGLALALVAPGGLLVQQSCSSRITAHDFYAAVLDEATRHGVSLEEVARTGHAVDHPVSFPEGAYLKGLVARVRPLR